MSLLVVTEETFNFAPLLIVIVLAFLVPFSLSRFRQIPIVVGEIIAGIIVGRSGFGWVHEDMILALMADIGLAFLMFLAGMEIDFETLFNQRGSQNKDQPNILFYASSEYLLTLVIAGLGSFLLYQMGLEGNPWLLALILSATSLGVLMPVLKESNLTRTRFGQTIFITATLADFITVILLTIYLIVQARGFDPQIFSIALLFLFFFLAYRLGVRFFRQAGVRRIIEELSRATVQIKVRGAIAILLSFVVLAEFVNAELILGAFLAGMVISLIKSPQDDGLVHNLEAFGFGFFIPVFFIMVGVGLDLSSLWESPQALLMLPVFLLVALLVKVVPTIVFRRFLSWREIIASGLLLNTHLSLEIAVAIIGARSGLLPPATVTTITLFAILTVLLMPLLFGMLVPTQAVPRRRNIAICGASFEALNVARELSAHGETVIILAENDEISRQAHTAGYPAVRASEEELGSILDPANIKGLLTLCSEDDRNLKLCSLARQAGIEVIVAQVNDPANLPRFREIGAQPYLPTLTQSVSLALMVRNPDVFALLTSATDERDVREVALTNPKLAGKALRDLPLPGEILILSIRRNGEFIIPHGNVQIGLGDRLTLLGCPDELEDGIALLRR